MQSTSTQITKTSKHRESVVASTFRSGTALAPVDREIANAVSRAQAGDTDAVRLLYLRYKDNVYGYVLSFVHDQHDAEDITQHVFLKLMSVIHKYHEREVPFTSWLLRVARNAALDHLRRRRDVLCEDVYENSHGSDDSGSDRLRGLQEALGTLPTEQRNVIVLRHLAGLTPGEIAEQMGRTESSVHGLHHRARRSLQRELIAIDCGPSSHAA